MFYKNKTVLFCYFYKTSIIFFKLFSDESEYIESKKYTRTKCTTGQTHKKVIHVQDEQKQ